MLNKVLSLKCFILETLPYCKMYLSTYTTQKMKLPIEDFFSKCDQIRSSSMENFIFVQCPVLHTDDENVMLIVRQLTKHILDLKIDIVGNRNIDNRGTGSRGLHLNPSGRSRFARNFVKIIKKF